MSKSYALELRFDSELNHQILNAWEIISQRGISSYLPAMKIPPHITLLSGMYPPSGITDFVYSFADQTKPYISLSLSSLQFVPEKPILVALARTHPVQFVPEKPDLFALAPTPSLSLLEFHSDLCNAMRDARLRIDFDYQEGSWVPYCPLAEQLPKTKMPEVINLFHELQLPFTGNAVRMTLVELPHRNDVMDIGFWEPADSPTGVNTEG